MAASVAIDGSKCKALNTRDKNFTRAKMERGLALIEKSVARYLSQLDDLGGACCEDGASQGEACQACGRAPAPEGD
jgi:hypothetical protein